MREAIEELGGPLQAVAKLGRRGISPMEIAIILLGGIGETATKLGISRQRFDRLRKMKPIEQWGHHHLVKLEELTGIPNEILVLPADEAVEKVEKP